MTDLESEPGADSSPDAAPEPTPPSAPAPRRRVVIISVFVALAVVTTVFSWLATKYSSARNDLDDVAAIRKAAGDFGAAALTYDYRDLAPFRARMQANATGTFKRQLKDGLSGLETLITTAKSVSEATVKQIYVGEIDGHSSSAVVVVEARARNGDAAARTLPAAYIELQLVKVGGRWRIDGVSSLDLGQAVPGGALPGNTTTTSQPAK